MSNKGGKVMRNALFGIISLFLAIATGQRAAAYNGTPPDRTVFESRPAQAEPKGRRACEIAKRYVETVNRAHVSTSKEQADEISALFADDAIRVAPNDTARGKAEIWKVYDQDFAIVRLMTEVVTLTMIGDDDECVTTNAFKSRGVFGDESYHVTAVDHFVVNKNGKIQLLNLYFRPLPANMKAVK
jgi:hypothetical protein